MGSGFYGWTATRSGEKSRKCERCGNEYVPRARNQKYCPDCKYDRATGRRGGKELA